MIQEDIQRASVTRLDRAIGSGATDHVRDAKFILGFG